MTYAKSKWDYVLCNKAGQTFNSDGIQDMKPVTRYLNWRHWRVEV